MPEIHHDIKQERKATTATVQIKPFPGNVPDASVFQRNFDAANKVGRTIKGIRQSKKNKDPL